jgi:hypothetical protein
VRYFLSFVLESRFVFVGILFFVLPKVESESYQVGEGGISDWAF